jgi:myo-inositol-1(or 4)-monophosphatase
MTTEKEMKEYLAAAREAAQVAGSLILKNWQQVKEVEFKSALDLVTSVDRQSEECIVEVLEKRFPRHSILAEEGFNIQRSQSDYRWIVDPLDGTTNFVHTYPHFSVSIALEEKGEIILGLVYDLLREESFEALQGKGAFLNGNPIHTSTVTELDKALLATGFPYDRREKVDFYLPFFRAFMTSSQGIRRNGSAALDLSYVACGRLDGFWEFALHPWDIAAGSLIVREAGGTLTDFSGGNFSIWGNGTLASNGMIHSEMLTIIIEETNKNVDSSNVD